VDGGRVTVKAIAAAKDGNGSFHNVIGAVNGDFFNLTTGSLGNILDQTGNCLKIKWGRLFVPYLEFPI
jgi:hypothetical protein